MPSSNWDLYAKPVKIKATYQNPNTLCMNSDSFPVVIENKIIQNTGVYRIDNYLYSNDPDGPYQWIDCNKVNQAIFAETNRKFTPTYNGNFAVVLTKGACNQDTSSCQGFYNVGIDVLLNQAIEIFPNPINDKLKIGITNPQVEIQTIQIYTSMGQTVWKEHFNINQNIPFSYPKGIYTIQIQTNKGIVIKKVIK